MDVQDVAIKRQVTVPRFAIARSAADAAPPLAPAPAGFGEIVSEELLAGFSAWRIWMILGWDDIRQRYRRSVLGPFWITLSMGMFILLLGIIYSRLFHTDLATYMPYLSVGYIVWGFISQITNESCMAFQEGARIIKQIKLPLFDSHSAHRMEKHHRISPHDRDLHSCRHHFQGRADAGNIFGDPGVVAGFGQCHLGGAGAGDFDDTLSRHPADRRHRHSDRDVRNADHVAAEFSQRPQHVDRRGQSALPFDRNRARSNIQAPRRNGSLGWWLESSPLSARSGPPRFWSARANVSYFGSSQGR